MDNAVAERESLSERVGHRFACPELLTEALSHRSWCHEHGGIPNERLEFLGDAVLGLCVCDHAMRNWPRLCPGELSAVRAAVVNAESLAEAARECGLGAALLLGRGEADTGGADKDSILADAFEAVLGAAYLDAGLDAARGVVDRLLGPLIALEATQPGAGEAKTRLQELVARQFTVEPSYRVSSSGPAHRPSFVAEALVGSEIWGRGEGSSKRLAERRAAEAAYARMTETSTQQQSIPEEPAHG